MSPENYSELKDWLKIALPLLGHGIAYAIFYWNNNRSDDRQRRDWENKRRADHDKFYLEKLESLHDDVLKISHSYQQFFDLWSEKKIDGVTPFDQMSKTQLQIEEVFSHASGTCMLYMPNKITMLLTKLYHGCFEVMKAINAYHNLTRDQLENGESAVKQADSIVACYKGSLQTLIRDEISKTQFLNRTSVLQSQS